MSKHIWYHRIENPTDDLRFVLSSGFFSHAIIRQVSYDYGRPNDDDKIQECLDICKRWNVQPIWSRWGHQQHPDSNYLDRVIYWENLLADIKAEADEFGCQSCLDMEVYPTTDNHEIRDLYLNGLTDTQYIDIDNAIRKAMQREGPVDYTLPSGYWWPHQNTLATVTRQVGNCWIGEHTYAQKPSRWKKAPYDIQGIKLTPDGEDSRGPQYPKFYLPDQVVEDFRDKDVFVYPSGGYAERLNYAEQFLLAMKGSNNV